MMGREQEGSSKARGAPLSRLVGSGVKECACRSGVAAAIGGGATRGSGPVHCVFLLLRYINPMRNVGGGGNRNSRSALV